MERLSAAFITHSDYSGLIAQCRARAPYESCGVLFGAVAGGAVRADGFAFIRNVAAHPERSFRFDPNEWIQVCYQAQKNQRSIVGFFHSHPNGSHHPSRQDAEGRDSSGSIWIADLSRQEGVLHVYGFDDAAHPHSAWYAIPLTVISDQ